MTDERQAVKTLAEQLVKAMKSVSANTPSKNYTNGTTPSTISASKIVGLPAAFSSIINGVKDAAAGGDAIAQMTLHALNHIAAGEFETITADTANIEKIYATFGDFIKLVAKNATIGDLDVETIRAGMGVIGLLTLSTADIEQAQIGHLSAENAFIRYGTGGKLYIDDLAVSNANIVNLAAGTILLNNSDGELVELYVDAITGDVTTRTVSYDGSDIINQNSLNGNRIVQNSITTAQLNANEIFAAQGTIMELIADNINVTRLFANQGFIQQLHTSIIGSDLSENSSIITLTDEINLMSSNTSRTFIQGATPFPVHLSDTWFDPMTEDHYIAAGITISSQQMQFGHDDAGNLSNIFTDDYEFTINSNGELAVLIKDEDLEDIITEHNVDFGIKEGGYLSASGLWNKIKNVAFSNLQVSVDGIISEVYDSEKGTSRIEQNADRIIAIVSGSQSVPYVKTNSIEIKEDLIEIKSSGNVDIKADNFSVSFNTEGSLPSKSRVDINNDVGIRVSDRYGGYFQANYNRIGLYDMQDTPRLYMDANGQAFFNGSLTLGGVRNTDGSLTIRNENGTRILFANKNGMEIYDATGNTRQFYLDSSTGNATFSGELKAASGTFAGELRSSTVTSGAITVGGSNYGQIIIKNSSNTVTGAWGTSGFTLYNSNGTIPQIYLDGATGNVMFAGNLMAARGTFAGELSAARGTFEGELSAACITSGTLNSERIASKSLSVDKITGSIETDDWGIDFTNGTMKIGSIAVGSVEADKITGSKSFGNNWGLDFSNGTINIGTITADKISGTKQLDSNWSIDFTNGLIYVGTVVADKISGTKTLGNNWSIDFTNGTMNIGSINADVINAGTINADRIASDSISVAKLSGSISGGDWGINLSGNGSFTVGTLSASSITSGTMTADWIKGGTLQITSEDNSNYWNSNGIYTTKATIGPFTIASDSFTANDAKMQIGSFYISAENTTLRGVKCTEGNFDTYFAGRSIYFARGGEFYSRIVLASTNELYVQHYISSSGGDVIVRQKTTPVKINNTMVTLSDCTITGSLQVRGTKNRIVSTSQYSDRLLYCYETPSPLFGDVGEGVISSDGQCYIPLDPIFAQTISTDQYQVFLQRYGEGDCYVSERHGSYFIVAGTPNLSFGWELKAKQSDFDQLRLERNDEKFSVPSQTYGEDAAAHIQELYNERTQQDNQQDNQESEE